MNNKNSAIFPLKVDFMLGSFMEEMQITPEQFEVACLEGRHTSPPQTGDGSGSDRHGFSFHQGLFQQIWAANDIRIFIRMMTQRNVELQLQALDLIERRQNSLRESESNSVDVNEIDETKFVKELLKQNSSSDDDVVEVMLKEGDDKPRNQMAADRENVVDEEVAQSRQQHDIEEKFQRLNLFFEKDRVNTADIQSRQEYLRSQRDKILEIKKKARTRQLNESVKKNGRPSSAQVAQKLMQGSIEDVSAEPPEASLQLRKTLAKRLRTEVVNPNGEAE